MQKTITTIKDAMDFIYGTTWKGSVLGLSRISELMTLLGEPQKKTKFVHIAGTNGKGSTAAMLASILTEAGYKTGLYTSPYIEKMNEMIQINSTTVSDSELVSLSAHMQPLASRMPDLPTEYEILTALAFLHFFRKACDIVVLEVGMGGRLDTTNVIDTPEVAIIASIGLDHMEQLGNTVEKIAGEKAGIIKTNGRVICHPQISSVEAVIREKCTEMHSSVMFVESNAISLTRSSIDGQVFNFGDYVNLEIPLLGEHQLRNAAVVVETVKALCSAGWDISQDALYNGLRNTCWAGRFEVLRKNPAFIVDVAHNPQGISAIIDTLEKVLPNKEPIFIFGVLADKDYEKMAELLTPCAKQFFLVTPENPRALPATKLAECIKRACSGVAVQVCENIPQAVNAALNTANDDDVICALGSLSMIGAVRTAILSTNLKNAVPCLGILGGNRKFNG